VRRRQIRQVLTSKPPEHDRWPASDRAIERRPQPRKAIGFPMLLKLATEGL
jgi:hypothetical protein